MSNPFSIFGGSGSGPGDTELQMLDTEQLGTPREGQTIKTGNIFKEGRGTTVFGKGIALSDRFFTLYVEDGRPTLKYIHRDTSAVLGVCDLTACTIAKSKNPRKDHAGLFAFCMRLDMRESPVNTNRDKLKLTLCFKERDDMNSWFVTLLLLVAPTHANSVMTFAGTLRSCGPSTSRTTYSSATWRKRKRPRPI